ncbi:MAG: xylulokinase [Ruminococcaceae bacterium]|nr:xylulokinase [Oscillospiraceae bacterium]
MLYIGIDLGTSSVKIILVDEKGEKLATVTRHYPVEYPKPGWSQQNPEDWYDAVISGLEELLDGQDKSKIAGLGVAGQMHGLVILDNEDHVIRPAILWNDGRTEDQVAYLNNQIGKDTLSGHVANIAFAGFTAPKILWLKEHEPENFTKIHKIMLPKDYIVYRLTGSFVTDYSDASGMLLLDVQNRCWSDKLCEICYVKKEWLPQLCDSKDRVGVIKKEFDYLFGGNEICVVAGAGDNAAAAIGTGCINDGECNISLGTSGTIFIVSDNFDVDNNNALHSFAYTEGRYHLMGCMLSAASCASWWLDILNSIDYDGEFTDMNSMLGDNQVYFLPYLMGERSPINDVNARAAFVGMNAATTRREMCLAVLEGVSFALRDCLEVARKLGINVNVSTCCGGGSKIKIWPQILSNVLGIDINLPATQEGPSLGAAMLAMVACGEYESVSEACDAIVKIQETINPQMDIIEKYNKKYEKFSKLYPALKDVF